MSEYYAPRFEVSLNGSSLPNEATQAVTEVAVTTEPNTLDHFRLTLANPYPELRWTHTDDADLFRHGGAVTIALGYGDALHPAFDGEITRISPTFPEDAMATLRIEGYTRLHRLQAGPRVRTFVNVTDKQIAEQIAGHAGLTPEAEQTTTQHPHVTQYNQSDLAFLLERARRIRFELLVEGPKLIFRKPRDDQPRAHTLVWGDKTAAEAPAVSLPLKSFTPTVNVLRPVETATVRGVDPKTRELLVGRAGSEDAVAMDGSLTGPAAARQAGRPAPAVVVDRPVASLAEADDRARAAYNAHGLGYVTGTATTVGVPELRAGQAVDLEGLGPRYGGRYYVTESTHRISSQGYRTTFGVRRNATG